MTGQSASCLEVVHIIVSLGGKCAAHSQRSPGSCPKSTVQISLVYFNRITKVAVAGDLSLILIFTYIQMSRSPPRDHGVKAQVTWGLTSSYTKRPFLLRASIHCPDLPLLSSFQLAPSYAQRKRWAFKLDFLHQSMHLLSWRSM